VRRIKRKGHGERGEKFRQKQELPAEGAESAERKAEARKQARPGEGADLMLNFQGSHQAWF
jgi:hypothetical protein